MLQLSGFGPHLGALLAACERGGHCHLECPEKRTTHSIPTCWNCDQQVTEAAFLEKKKELECRWNLLATTPGSAGRTFFLKYTITDRSFAAPLHSSNQQHQQQPSQQRKQHSSGKHMHQDINRTSGESMQTKNVYSNESDMYFAFIMMQRNSQALPQKKKKLLS
jgi:hypothetical protein